jgi:cobalt-zinc-cadmium efflux system protein
MPILPHGEGEAEARILVALRLAVQVSVAILVLEVLGALFSRSLSLTVDALHDVPDLFAFLLSWRALRSTSKGPSEGLTFGSHRSETFAGVLNAGVVLVVGAAFGVDAVAVLWSRSTFAGPVNAIWLLAAAGPTLVLRVTGVGVLSRLPGKVRDLNLAGVLFHLASDIAITGALLVVGVVLLVQPGWGAADPLAALVIAGILVYVSIPLLREGWRILTERAPRGISVDAIERTALSVPGVAGLHDLHVWSVCSSLVCLTAHVGVKETSLQGGMAVVAELRRRMEQEFGIVHSTFEIEGPSGA